MRNKKITVTAIHILSVILVAVSLWSLHFNHYKGEDEAYKNIRYEDSSRFHEEFFETVQAAFEKIRLSILFERNGELDLKKVFIRAREEKAEVFRDYTLEDIILYGKKRGLYLDNMNELLDDGNFLEEEGIAEVEWKIPELDFLISREDYILDDDGENENDGSYYISFYNLAFQVLTQLGGYYKASEAVEEASNFKYRLAYGTETKEQFVFTNAPELSLEELMKVPGKYIFNDFKNVKLETNFQEVDWTTINEMVLDTNVHKKPAFSFYMTVDESYPVKTDKFYNQQIEYNRGRQRYLSGNLFLGLGFTACVITALYLLYLSCKKGESKLLLTWLDRGYIETSLIVWGIGAFLLIKVFHILVNFVYLSAVYRDYTKRLAGWCILYLALEVGVLSLVRRFRAGVLWESSLGKKIYGRVNLFLYEKGLAVRLVAAFLAYLLVDIAAVIIYTYNNILGITLAIIFNIFVLFRLMVRENDRQVLKDGITRIAEGDQDYQIDSEPLKGLEKELAQKLNQISVGLKKSVEEKMKSERLKTDLITNVSHDIKTPLTSIINYVELLKREPIKDEKVLGYIEVLDSKAQRLKNLTEDLVEASKASSGNLTLELMDIDFVELVNQTNGEFEEKFAAARLEMVTSLPEESIFICADGRRMWRILENLYNNVVKYAMAETRVYIAVKAGEKSVEFSIKNVSSYSLNINADELTERFVRGDISRSTEGSGLGLSIAQSLTKLQGGSFELYIDGDLFKSVVTMPRKE